MTSESNRKKSFQVVLGIIIGSFIISLILFCIHTGGTRRVCCFRSFDSDRLCTEVRYFPRMNRIEAVEAFVQDLLLGPFTNRYKPIFASGTRLEFCFADGKTLYLGFSAQALKPEKEISDIDSNVQLIRKNIVKNFTNFNKICIFIDGVQVSG
ncbi:MAG: hypothetical protein SOZ72_09885 [Treponema sp.]|uniref:GerMN domain-containing protein n=1 Tax=Treponema sp. TaxID=166 RepID=UPI00298E869C|nr:hypothetical protein [Treponema sp.]MCI7398560.1 hypothetical protein [Spirochaetia bacterium]MCI7578063.1 hypothetical protein [Spirochaetia bacterium]MDY3759669.1 hypothetical protein [Treponema sp.]